MHCSLKHNFLQYFANLVAVLTGRILQGGMAADYMIVPSMGCSVLCSGEGVRRGYGVEGDILSPPTIVQVRGSGLH